MQHTNTTRQSTLDRVAPILRMAARASRPVRGGGAVGALVGTILSGCVHQRSAATAAPTNTAPRIADSAHTVPPAAPDYRPESLFTALGLVHDESQRPTYMVRSIVKVLFKDGATQSERQQAIDAIRGVVVGGFRMDDDDGAYYVRIPGPTYDDIQAAVRRLRPLPQVTLAVPFFVSIQGGIRT